MKLPTLTIACSVVTALVGLALCTMFDWSATVRSKYIYENMIRSRIRVKYLEANPAFMSVNEAAPGGDDELQRLLDISCLLDDLPRFVLVPIFIFGSLGYCLDCRLRRRNDPPTLKQAGRVEA